MAARASRIDLAALPVMGLRLDWPWFHKPAVILPGAPDGTAAAGRAGPPRDYDVEIVNQGSIDIAIGSYNVRTSNADASALATSTALTESIGSERAGARTAYASVRDSAGKSLVDITAHGFFDAGFGFGLCLVPETDRLFAGAGESARCYVLGDHPKKLWEDSADSGFLSWQRIGGHVFMSAELEFAAWKIDGTKLWTTFVEPPWNWRMVDGIIELEVMGTVARFTVAEGPPGPPQFW
jgi:hypothetical protein